jgi:hypothetical protein
MTIIVEFSPMDAWPSEIEPTFAGYSLGKWIDEHGDGRHDVLEVETRGPLAEAEVHCVKEWIAAFAAQ